MPRIEPEGYSHRFPGPDSSEAPRFGGSEELWTQSDPELPFRTVLWTDSRGQSELVHTFGVAPQQIGETNQDKIDERQMRSFRLQYKFEALMWCRFLVTECTERFIEEPAKHSNVC